MSDPHTTPYGCIDPPVGGEIWRLEQPNLGEEQRRLLEAHLTACDACRLVTDLDLRLTELGRSQDLQRKRPPGLTPNRVAARNSGPLLSGLALAASLVLMISLPPRPTHTTQQVRGSERTLFIRPVEGEVVAAGRPVLQWQAVSGANRYYVELRDQDGRSLWLGESPVERIQLPESVFLDVGHTYRALLSADPPDLIPPGQTSVAFRRDSWVRMVLHRLRWSHPLLQVAGALSLGVLLVFTFWRRASGQAAVSIAPD